MERAPAKQQMQSVSGLCGVCPSGCGATIQLEAGRIKRVVPRRDHPLGLGCARMANAAQIVYSPDRLLHPMQRQGPRGAGQQRRISWDQAYDMMAERMQALATQHGPESLCVYTGRGNFERLLCDTFMPAGPPESSANAVLFPFGSPNTTGVGSFCYVTQGMIAPRSCFGGYRCQMAVDWDQADLLLVWGANPATASPRLNQRRLARAAARGARVVVIDHRRIEAARLPGARWIGIRPGTDGALALGLINEILRQELQDQPFVQGWTHGLEPLRQLARRFTPQEVQRICWVPAEQVQGLARQIASASGCAVVTYSGLEFSNSAVHALRAVWSLMALTGHLDAPGGNVFRMPGRLQLRAHPTAPPAGAPPPIGAAEYPLYRELRNEAHAAELPRAILQGEPYPIRGLIVSGASLITSWPQPELWRRALAALDLLVVVNRVPTADAAYADLLLPAATHFETESLMVHDDRLVEFRPRIIAPRGEARSDHDIFAGLARRLGYGHLWPADARAAMRHALQGTGITLEQLMDSPGGVVREPPAMRYRKYALGSLRADGAPGFETPSSKFEFSSRWLQEHGYEPLPVYVEPTEGPLSQPDLAATYPLVLSTGAVGRFLFRSQHREIAGLVQRQPRPVVLLHSADAAARGVAHGDPVFVLSPRGRVPVWAEVTDGIKQGVAEVSSGGGGTLGPAAWREANVNELTDLDNRDALSGFPVFRALLCEVVLRAD